MTADRDSVMRARRLRWEFLLALYDLHEKLPSGRIQSVPAFTLAQEIGITDKAEADRTFTYLKNAGLLKFLSMGPSVSITKAGIDEVEEAIASPERPNVHFGPINLLHVAGNVVGSQLQQGTHESSQSMTFESAHQSVLAAMLPEIRDALKTLVPDDQQAAVDVDTLERQLASPKPRVSIIRELLASVRNVIEEAGGDVLATKILSFMQQSGLA